MLKQICGFGKWVVFALLLMLGLSAGAVHAASYDSLAPLPTDALWGTADSPWQAETGLSGKAVVWKKYATVYKPNNYAATYTGSAADLFEGSSDTDTYTSLKFSFSIPNINGAAGQANTNYNNVKLWTTIQIIGAGTPAGPNVPAATVDYSSGSAGNYATKVTSVVATPSRPIKATDQVKLIVYMSLNTDFAAALPDSMATGISVVTSLGTDTATDVPQVIKAFTRDSVTGADIGTQPIAIFGEGEAMGAITHEVTTQSELNDGDYRYVGGQLFDNESSVAKQTVDSNTLTIADLKTSLLKQAVIFWYDAKDSNIPVYYVDENNQVIDTSSMSSPPTSSAWGYNNDHIYQAGTTTEDDANLLTAPDTLTSGDSSYQYQGYDYYGDTDNSTVPTTDATATGTALKQQTLAGQVGKQAIVFRYKTTTNVGVHYWNIDKYSSNVPTSSKMDVDDNATNPAGLTFTTPLTGVAGAEITGTTADPIDTDGSGGIAAPKAPDGWYYIGYNYNDGSGTNQWTAYDPNDTSTARFKGKFTDQDQGISFLYRQDSALSLVLPDILDFGTVLPGSSSTSLQATTGGDSGNPNGLMVAVLDGRSETEATNAQLDPWRLTLKGTVLTDSDSGKSITDASIDLADGGLLTPVPGVTLADSFTLPLNGTTQSNGTEMLVFTSTAGPGKSWPVAYWANADVNLKFPTASLLKAGEYHSTLTWTLTSGY
ncbi:WxL domain-containing protein [Loigolactobacillus zhaoyuanensis]|uniref:WxL domain-containing protein n=1 Tax=Loigolactobacillus zhaoyuanensis TaxID=2486017 RepID=A0ABW8UE11_9LACO